MSHSSRIFDRVPIDLPNRSGFDLSHENLFTATTGTLIPCLIHPLLPNDSISLGTNFQVQLPPMVTDFYGKVDAVVEVFFVPNRLLWGGWESFITHPTKNPQYPEGTLVEGRPMSVPQINLKGLDAPIGPGSLADYLGLKQTFPQSYTRDVFVSAMPFLAYHRIWDDWYRDTRIQAPLFYRPPQSVSLSLPTQDLEYFFSETAMAAYCPYQSLGLIPTSEDNVGNRGPIFANYTFGSEASGYQTFFTGLLGDNVSLLSLRQRNWAKGYFTTATTLPQAGEGAEIQLDVQDGTGALSIAAIRSANSLQKWEERNNFSYRYPDQIHAQFGIYPDSAKMDRAIFLGRLRSVVYNRSVFQTADGEGGINDVVGSKKGSSQVLAEDSLVKSFRASEHGYLVAIFSLVPHSYYSTGSSREFDRIESEDFPFPLLAGMGDQAIKVKELTGITGQQDWGEEVFGYNDLYAEYKYIEDEVHGLLRDGQYLESFAIQRSFVADADGGPQLGSDFLLIPKNALDQVQAVATSEQGFSCWVDMYFTMKKVSTLPAYSLPTLADMKDVHTGYVSRGGTRL